jgi:hypothetical protein
MPAKLILAKPTPAKGKGKVADIKLDPAIETITLIATELGVYYKEAYYIRHYTLIIINNLLINFH